MSENVIYLHSQPEPIAHYLRLGAFHRQVEKLFAAGLLSVERVVVEASASTHQKATTEMLQRTSERLARLGPVLRDLHATAGEGTHARAPARRGNRAASARAMRR